MLYSDGSSRTSYESESWAQNRQRITDDEATELEL
jgi:hypothetical protein